MSQFRRIALSVVFTTLAMPTVGQADTLKAEGGSAAGISALVPQLLSKYIADEHEIRVNVDQTLSRSALKVANGSIELSSVPAGAYAKMVTGKGPYKKISEQAIKASGEIRSLFSFLGGHIHPLTHADSGVESWEDIRGKRVFVGPPAGSAAGQSIALIKAITGMEANKDYEAIKLAWSAANQAFEDGKFDLFMRTGTRGSAAVNQFGAAKPFRILGIPEATIGSPAWDIYASVPGRAADTIPAGTYDNQVNKDQDLFATAYVMFVGVNKDMSDDVAYSLTKAMFENLEDAHSVSDGLAPLTLDNAFVSLKARLHPGAIRYYEEVGVAVPNSLR